MASFLRLPTVMAKTGLSRSGIYAAIAEGSFPKQIPLGQRAVGWKQDDIDEWIEQRTSSAEILSSVSINAAAKQLGIQLDELKSFIDTGRLNTFRIGRNEMVRLPELNSFQDANIDFLRASAE
jgi:prophage regulatory protein